MIGRLKQGLFNNLKNIPGWKSKRKIVVIECDDWGGIRMPSQDVFNKLKSQGLNVDTSWFNRYDTIASSSDLERLFECLNTVKDSEGKSAVVTPIINVTNPDFKKIRQSDFKKYSYELFTETLKRYYPNENVFEIWKQGMSSNIFTPELHGREHVTVQLWMEALQHGNKQLRSAFDNEFVALDLNGVHDAAKEFRAEFYFNKEQHKPFLKNAIADSVKIFKEELGYAPSIFVPANGIFHPDFDNDVVVSGIKYLFVSNKMPYPNNEGELKYRMFVTGQKGSQGLRYYTRNCAFEPSDTNYAGLKHTMNQIEAAFRWGKPATISTHRVNFVGAISRSNAEKGLEQLQMLLQAIIKKWPDVEFLSAKDSLEYMSDNN